MEFMDCFVADASRNDKGGKWIASSLMLLAMTRGEGESGLLRGVASRNDEGERTQ